MKTFRKILKLLLPAFVVQIWLYWRHGIKAEPSPWHGIAGFALTILPYAFTAALSVREDTDVRLLKYFLPYGKMKRFVKLAYGIQRSDTTRDRGMRGVFRAILPYGLVIWWDTKDASTENDLWEQIVPIEKVSEGNNEAENGEQKRQVATAVGMSAESGERNANVDSAVISFFKVSDRISNMERREFQCIDRINVMILRLLNMMAVGGRKTFFNGGGHFSGIGCREPQCNDGIEAIITRFLITTEGGVQAPYFSVGGQISDKGRRELLLNDRNEAMITRLLITMTGV